MEVNQHFGKNGQVNEIPAKIYTPNPQKQHPDFIEHATILLLQPLQPEAYTSRSIQQKHQIEDSPHKFSPPPLPEKHRQQKIIAHQIEVYT